MAKLGRVFARIFAKDAGPDQVSQFGSLYAGAPDFTTSADTAQSLSNWLTGWFGAAIGGNAPAIEDMNSVCFVLAYQIAYLMQSGVPEWDTNTVYYIGSLASNSTGVVYISKTDNNSGNALSNTTHWKIVGGDIMTTLGDIIYAGSNGNATRLSGNTDTTPKFLSQTGTGSASSPPVWLPVAVKNVLEYQSQSGYGSVATKIPYYANTIENAGSAITGANDSTNGASATINESGVYSVRTSWTSPVSTSSYVGISLGASVTTNISSLTWGTQALVSLETGTPAGLTPTYEATWTGWLESGSVVRPHTNGVATGGVNQCSFRIVKIV